MLRKGVLWAGGLLVLFGLGIAMICHSPAGLGPAVFGAIMVLAVLFERWVYKRIVDGAPGPGWQPTGEKFLDPSSEVLVEVYFQPATGKRVYVRAAQ